MSAPQPKHHAYDDAQAAELARWPGVAWYRQIRAKHYALVLEFNGVSRFVIYPTSPGDAIRGALNHLRDVKAELRALGATRTAELRTTQPRRQRNRTESARLERGEAVTGGPMRDPWATLKGLEIKAPAAVADAPAPIVKPSLWRRILNWFSQ